MNLKEIQQLIYEENRHTVHPKPSHYSSILKFLGLLEEAPYGFFDSGYFYFGHLNSAIPVIDTIAWNCRWSEIAVTFGEPTVIAGQDKDEFGSKYPVIFIQYAHLSNPMLAASLFIAMVHANHGK